jgi:hypothetical protein
LVRLLLHPLGSKAHLLGMALHLSGNAHTSGMR